MNFKERFEPPVRAMYGIQPPVRPNIDPVKLRDETQDQETNHKHPEIEERLEKIC